MEAEPRAPRRFVHEVTFYAGPEDHTRAVLPFVQEGLARQEPVMVALLPDRLETLRRALGPDCARVEFVDMAELGANPARIIPAWRRFLDEHSEGGPVRGVGEPAWPGRRAVELAEAALHESLLNLAFDPGPGWSLLCPYDLTALPQHVIEEAGRNHPVLRGDDAGTGRYAGHAHAHQSFSSPLPSPPSGSQRIDFQGSDLALIRDIVARAAQASRLTGDVADDLALAVHELATNSVIHGGGHGSLVVWDEHDALVVEVLDRGRIHDPLVGRHLPDPLGESGRGVWMANQLCDFVQVRSGEWGTQVRLLSWL